jgi:hypothetical protein
MWLASAALLVSGASAAFSGLQWFEAHSVRNRPAPIEVIESPRLSFESAGAVKMLQDAVGFHVDVRSGRTEQIPPDPRPSLFVTLRFKNTGRTAASNVGCTNDSQLSYAATSTDPTTLKSVGLPYPIGTRQKVKYRCDPESDSGTPGPALTVSAGESVQFPISSIPLSKAELESINVGRLALDLVGTVSYEDSFHRMLKANWLGNVSLRGDGFRMEYVDYVP